MTSLCSDRMLKRTAVYIENDLYKHQNSSSHAQLDYYRVLNDLTNSTVIIY